MKNKAKKITIDDLAMMTKHGFDDVGESIRLGFGEVNKKLEETNNNIRVLSENNTREHEEIKMRLDNVAYRKAGVKKS